MAILGTAAIAGAASAGTAALAAGAFAGATFMGGSFLTHFLISTAMGAALSLLSPKPSSAGSGGYSLTGASGAALDHQIVYGRCKVGGVRLYDCTTGDTNKFLHRILAFAGHKIESYDEIYVGDELVTLDTNGEILTPTKWVDYVTIKQYFGTDGQNAVNTLIEATSALTPATGQWTTDHKLSGIAYLYVKLKYSSDKFPNGVPVISAVIKGRKVYDPRTTLTAWSDNTALCVRDYLTSSFGLAQTSARVDDALVTIAANKCDEVTQSESRYTCSGAFLTSAKPSQVVSDMVSSMGGLFWYSSGLWKMKAAAYTAPTLSFDEVDLRSGLSVSTRYSRRDNFNSVKGTFSGAESDWQAADYPEVTSTAFVTADSGVVNTVDFTLPYSKTTKTAQRLARIFLNRNREQVTVSASFGLKALQCDVGDNINLSNTRFGWTNKPFEVLSWALDPGEDSSLQINMTLREISSGVFTEGDPAAFESNNTTLLSADYQVPIGLVLGTEYREAKEGVVTVLTIDVTSGQPDLVERVQIQYQLAGTDNWKSVGQYDLGIAEVSGLEDGLYDVRAKSSSYTGVKGEWEFVYNYELSSNTTIPGSVTGFYIDVTDNTGTMYWDEVADPTLSHYKIRHSELVSGANWADAVTYIGKVARPATSVSTSVKPGTYMIRAYDKYGNSSLGFTAAVVNESDLQSYLNTSTDTESTTFTGTKTGCSVTSGELRITSVSGSAPFSATYDFQGYIDTLSVQKFRARIDNTVVRFATGSVLFDDLTGSFDSLPGLFDDLTGGTNFNDITLETYISTTDDNPAGSPTWSAYDKIKSGIRSGRAARFRVILKSSSTGVTPSITSMRSVVDYN
jgi:hypothetical protein